MRRLLLPLGLLACTAAAQPLRDPMQPPAAPTPAAAPSATPTGTEEGAPAAAPRHLITVDGRRYLVEQGRRLGVGDRLGNARIEAIDDTGVLLHSGGRSLRLPLFGSAQWRPAAPASAAAPPPPDQPTPRPGRRGAAP